MASRRLFTVFLVTFAVVILLLKISPCCSQNVTVSLYYETLCPYCADFIVNHLAKVFENGLISILNLRFIPWGNALIETDGTIVCQHGPDECLLNTIDACTITIYPDVERNFRFIYCIERITCLEKKLSNWINCFQLAGLGMVHIDCYRNGYGTMLEQKYAAETAQLNPPHRFVPWVVVNNQPLSPCFQLDYKNFARYICNAYKGPQVPEACQVLPLRNNSVEKANQSNPVCYVSEAKT